VFKRSKEQEKKGSEKREDLLVSFLKDAHFVFAIIKWLNKYSFLYPVTLQIYILYSATGNNRCIPVVYFTWFIIFYGDISERM